VKTSFGGRSAKSSGSVTPLTREIETPNGKCCSAGPQCKGRVFRPAAMTGDRCSERIFASGATEVESRRAWRADASVPKTAECGLGAAVKTVGAHSTIISSSFAVVFILCINPVYQIGTDLKAKNTAQRGL